MPTSPLVPRRPYVPWWSPLLAWVVILAAAGWMVWPRLPHVPAGAEPAPKHQSRGLGLQEELIGKMLVALAEWVDEPKEMLLGQAEGFRKHPDVQRLAYVALAGELLGPRAAIDELHATLDQADSAKETMNDAQRGAAGAMSRLYEDCASGAFTLPSLDEEDRRLLREELGWFGELALRPAQSPDADAREALVAPLRRLPIVVVIFSAWLIMCGLIGFGALITLLAQALLGGVRHGFEPGASHGAIYAETFAVWMLLWIAISSFRWEGPGLLYPAVGMLVSLSSLMWPVLRGIPFTRVRQDVGLRLGSKPGREILMGLLCYTMALPLAGAGLLISLALIKIQEVFLPGAEGPSHPVQQALVGGTWWVAAQALLLGALIAPLAEEIMFRGVLYRYLRNATGRLGVVVSALLSTFVSSLLFAAIHPQGWTLIPALMGIAFGLCLAREWRGTLLPGMIAHGTHNAVLLSMSIALFGGS